MVRELFRIRICRLRLSAQQSAKLSAKPQAANREIRSGICLRKASRWRSLPHMRAANRAARRSTRWPASALSNSVRRGADIARRRRRGWLRDFKSFRTLDTSRSTMAAANRSDVRFASSFGQRLFFCEKASFSRGSFDLMMKRSVRRLLHFSAKSQIKSLTLGPKNAKLTFPPRMLFWKPQEKILPICIRRSRLSAPYEPLER